MSAIRHIWKTHDTPIRVVAGKHFAEPLLIEAGSERHVSIELAAGAKLHLTAFAFAVRGETATTDGVADTAKFSLTVNLTGEGAEFHLYGLYMALGAGHVHIDARVNHLASDCTSRQLIKGIAADAATGSFTGMVHVAHDAQRTNASQRNQNLQVTDTAHIFTSPQLEIYADDVRCSHGATVGQLDEEAIYYMRQRGISEAEARRMQIQGFAGEIVNYIHAETYRKTIGEKIYELIDKL